MSQPVERKYGQSDANSFSGRMLGHLGDTEFNRFIDMGRNLDAPTGFKGLRMEHEIAMWDAFGYGKKLGGKISRGSMYEQVPVDLSEYRGSMYAMPLTDPDVKGYDQRMLVVLPNVHTVEMAIVGPIMTGNPKSLEKFNERFSPSPEPYLHTAWNLRPEDSPLVKFIETQGAFYAKAHSKIGEKDHVTILNHATAVAQEWKEFREKNWNNPF